MYLVQEKLNFYLQDGEYCPRYGKRDENICDGDDSKERLENMSYLHLEMLPREGEVVSFDSFDAALEMHTLLNRVGNGLVLDKSDVDKRKQELQSAREDDEAEDKDLFFANSREYHRYLLLLTSKRFESEILSALKSCNDELW